MRPHPGSRFVMIGDSVTDCGRARPVGEGPGEGLGHGYVAVADALWCNYLPDHPIRIINTGVGCDTVRDLAARWATDVTALRPDWLAVMIGINDVWRQFDPDPTKRTQAVPPEEFTATYDRLLAAARPSLQGLVLLTPFYLEPRRTEPMRARMDEYGELVRQLATRHAAILVDTQAAFDRMLRHAAPAAYSRDQVHPNLTGHLILARAFLAGLGVTVSAR